MRFRFPKLVAATIYKNVKTNELFDSAAALSFYFTFSLFPGLLLLVSVAEIFLANGLGESHVWVVDNMPAPVRELIWNVVGSASKENRLGIASVSFFFAIWTASSGILAAIRQINISLEVKEMRSIVRQRWIAILLTAGLGVLAVVPMVITSVGSLLTTLFPMVLPEIVYQVLSLNFIRYCILLTLLMVSFSLFYYFGPSDNQPFRFFSPGGIFGAITLVLVSYGFEVYLEMFNSFDRVYGGIGAVMILMMWLYFLGILLVLGGEINKAYYSKAK